MEAPSLAKMKLSVVKHLMRTATETAACVMNANICIGSQHNACVMIERFRTKKTINFLKQKSNVKRQTKFLARIEPPNSKDQLKAADLIFSTIFILSGFLLPALKSPQSDSK